MPRVRVRGGAYLVTTRQEVRDRVVFLTSEITKIPVSRLTESATIDQELKMESLSFVELQVAIEDEYQIEIDPIRVLELNELGAIVDYVYRQVNGAE